MILVCNVTKHMFPSRIEFFFFHRRFKLNKNEMMLATELDIASLNGYKTNSNSYIAFQVRQKTDV